MTGAMPYQPWQAYMPTPYQIPYFAWVGSPTNVDSKTGNIIEIWASPVPQWVQDWDILTSEKLPGFQTEERFEVFLMVPPTFWPQIRDRFGLPVPSNNMTLPTQLFDDTGRVEEGIFEVVGHDIEAFGGTNWQPGNIVLLKLAE